MPSGDSISKYDASRDLYSVKPTPMQQKRAVESTGFRKGTVDTMGAAPTDKSERSVPVAFFPKSAYILGDQVVKIARAGRFIFFAFSVPPFFLFYTLPKWMGLNLIVPFISIVEKNLDSVKKFIQKLFKSVSESFENTFRNILGKISWKNTKIEKQSSSLLAYLGQNFHKIREQIESLINKMVSDLSQKITLPLKNTFKSVTKKFNELFKESKEIYNNISEKVGQYAKNGYQTLIQPVMTFFAPTLQYIAKPLSLALGWSRELINDNIKPLMKAVTDKVKDLTGDVANKIAHVYTQVVQVIQPVINYLAIDSLQFLKKHLSFGLTWLKEKPKEHFERFAKMAQTIVSKISPHLNQILDRILGRSAGFWRWIFGYVYRSVTFVFRKLFAAFKFVCLHSKNYIQKSHNRLYRGASFLKGKISDGADFCIAQVKAMIKSPIAYFTELFKKGMIFLLQILRFVALVMIAIFLVFRFWFKMLFELSESVLASK